MPDSSVPITAGVGTNIDTYTLANGDHRQRVIVGNYGGSTVRSTSYRTPGRAGTTGQNLFAIWNAAGSTVEVNVSQLAVDVAQTAAKVVIPPLIRTLRLSNIPTGGTAGFKTPEETNQPSNASVSVFQDASADNTSGTALAFTQTTAAFGLTQEWAPRALTLTGYEPADRVEFLDSGEVTLRAGEGIGVRLDYTVATSNPVTDMYVITARWEEILP